MDFLDSELVARIKNLKMDYAEEPQPELLIQIPNREKNVQRTVTHQTSEFTSLCPLNTSQPDHATICIVFEPKDFLVELKSLKFYFVSFRQVPIFHEEAPARILKDLLPILGDVVINVTGYFTVRGGLQTEVDAVNIPGTEESRELWKELESEGKYCPQGVSERVHIES